MKSIFMASLCMIFMADAAAQDTSAVDGFFKVCMGALGNQDSGEAIARKLGFVPASAEQKQTLLREGAAGAAYTGEKMAIVLERDGLCTVYAHTNDQAALQAQLKKALPPPSTLFKVSEEPVNRHSDVTGMVYHLALPTRPFADWIFSAYNRPGKYNIAISMQLR